MEKVVPAAGWLRGYGRGDLARDFSAALVITVMLVPQSMAYALLAGLPPIYGLYASTVPAVVYALFGTSKHMPVGPPALMALLTLTSVSAIAEPGSEEYIGYVLLLAFMVGVLQLALGLLKMGFLTNFISHPVLSGFIYASAVIIALSQVKHFLGIPSSEDHSTTGMVVAISDQIGEANPLPLVIGVASVAAIVLLGRLVPRIPGAPRRRGRRHPRRLPAVSRRPGGGRRGRGPGGAAATLRARLRLRSDANPRAGRPDSSFRGVYRVHLRRQGHRRPGEVQK